MLYFDEKLSMPVTMFRSVYNFVNEPKYYWELNFTNDGKEYTGYGSFNPGFVLKWLEDEFDTKKRTETIIWFTNKQYDVVLTDIKVYATPSDEFSTNPLFTFTYTNNAGEKVEIPAACIERIEFK